MTGGEYLASAVSLLAIAGSLGFGGYGIRRWVCGEARGLLARLGEATAAIAIAVLVIEGVGTLGLLKEAVTTVALVAAGLGAGALGVRRSPGSAPTRRPMPVPERRLIGIGVVIAALTVAAWSFPSLLALDRGMLDGDTTWYHLPAAARFAQDASVTGLHFTDPQELAVWFYPAGWEMLTGAGIVIAGSDWLAPLFNLTWVVMGLAAAYCIGSARGTGPASLIACAIVLNSAVLLETQAGEGRNDMMAIALLLACVAFLVHAWPDPGRQENGPDADDRHEPRVGFLVLAGIAGGLAASVKLTMLAPVLIVVLGAIFAGSGGRGRALAVGIPAFACGCFWYVRNLVHTGNPIPQVSPGFLPGPDQMPLHPRPPHGITDYLLNTDVWTEWFHPDLERAFGSLYPLVFLAAVAAVGFLLVARTDPPLRITAAAVIATAVVWLVLPIGAAGPFGEPRGFFTNTRYLAPALAVGMALVPIALQRLGWRSGGSLAVALTIAFAWSTHPTAVWSSRFGLGAALLAFLLVVAPLLVAWGVSRGPAWRRGAIAAAVVTAACVVIAGREEQQQFERHHYANAELFLDGGGPVRAIELAQGASDKRIGLAGSGELYFAQYGFYGRDLTNHVQYVGVRGPQGQFTLPTGCSAFRRAVNAGDYDYLVLTPLAVVSQGSPYAYPLRAWVEGDPGLRRLFVENVEPQAVVVYEVREDLDPSCRA